MGTVTIQTTQNIGIDYEVAGLGERVVATVIDYGIFIVSMIFGLFLMAAIDNRSTMVVLMIIWVILYVFYDLACETLFNGQSLGKRVMKIRVISLDGARPSFSQYLMRWLFRIVDFGISSGAVALICTACTKNVQRVGDIVAGTTLIKTEPRTQIQNLVFTPANDDYQPVFNEVVQLTDNDIALVSEVLNNYYKTGNTVIVFNMAERLKKLLNVQPPATMDDMHFLQTIVRDYSHMVSANDFTI
ncbi:RDD family protein [Mucilaginibacter hurinus]|uniref:RDD family protein n=1 Tax=Mucilaginibacter hurinus TaxID=2201324 RepID=A0A367GM08_9SPHI|nr:RDD family protein [Mucilaginibacter hurinus]RCH53723.1 RDD family protein [Mucilaginibacter hurinus]